MSMIRQNNSLFRITLLLIIFSFLFCSVSMGSETNNQAKNIEIANSSESGGHTTEEHSTDRSRDLLDLLYRFINFALLVIILVIVIRKTTIKDIFKNRTEEIRHRLDNLRKEKEEAEARYEDIASQLKDFESRKKEIIDQFIKEGLDERERIISEAKERVDQIIVQSEMTINHEIQLARNRLKDEVVDLAAKKAKEIISGEFNEKDQDKLIDDFIERMGKLD